VTLQGFFELNGNGSAFGNRASAWLVGAQARWNLFSGLADIARVREAALASTRADAERDRVETEVRVDVRTAAARVRSAAAREQVGQAAVAQARESQRIVRDRYDAGMASVNDVLRAANAVLDAESQRIGALVDLLVSHAMFDRALGRSPADIPK
jgi:outer membrane protein TolC